MFSETKARTLENVVELVTSIANFDLEEMLNE